MVITSSKISCSGSKLYSDVSVFETMEIHDLQEQQQYSAT